MKKSMRLSMSIFALAMFCVLSVITNVQAAVDIGSSAPDFTLIDQSETERSLSDFTGQYVVLEWLNHGCPFVKKHYGSGNMQNLQEQYTAEGVIWLSIVSSAPGAQGYCTPQEAADLIEEKEASPTAVLLDPDGTVGKMYEAKTTPHMFIIDPQGNLIYKGAIDDIPSADPDDIAQATNYVDLALTQSMAGEAVATPSTKSYGCAVKY